MSLQPTLSTARLILRPFRPEDRDDVVAYVSSPGFARFLPLPEPYGASDAERFIESVLALDWHVRCEWAIERQGHVIGAINVRFEPEHGRASVGYGIGSGSWGLGIATEAGAAVVEWAFKHHDLRRIYATADAENVASRRVLEKLGLSYEGTLHGHRLLRGEPRDEVTYGMLRPDWQRPQV